MILAGKFISSYTGRRSFAFIKEPSNKVFLLGAFLLLYNNQAFSQIDQLLQNGCLRNKVKTQTTLQRNYKGTTATGPEFTKAYAEYNNAGKKLSEKTFDETPQLTKQYNAMYDDANRLLKEMWKEEYTDSVVYKYDKNHNLAEERWYWEEDKTKSIINHFYDGNNRLVCTISSQNSLGKIVDSLFYLDNRLALIRSYNEYGQLSTNNTHIYDRNGRLVEEIKTNAAGQVLQKISKLYYDAGLLKSDQTSYYSLGDAKNKTKEIAYSQTTDSYKYINELPSEQTTVSVNNKEKVIDTQTNYTFDAKGLLVEQEVVNLLTHEKSVYRYTYTFYQ